MGKLREVGDKKSIINIDTYLRKAHFIYLSRVRVEAWKLNVNNIILKHIERGDRFLCSLYC